MMGKTYYAFVEQLRKEIMEATGLDRTEIWFKQAEDDPKTEGDRLFVNFFGWEANNEVLALHTEELFSSLDEGSSMEEIVRMIRKQYLEVKEAGYLERILDLSDYDKVCDDLFIRAISTENNEKELENAVYCKVGDIALTVYFCVQNKDENLVSMKILKPFVEKWGISEDEVYRKALQNAPRFLPPRFWNLEKMMFQPGYQGEDFMTSESKYEIRDNVYGECLSTLERRNGATAIFLPGVADRIAEMMGCGFYAVFTSIHEVMIHADHDMNATDLHKVLDEILQEMTKKEEFLTRKIYHYDPVMKKFTWK